MTAHTGVHAREPHRRLLRAVRRVPAIVWWITALHIALLLAYSVLLPTHRAPDEPLHVSLSRQFADDLHYPAWDEGQTDMGIQRSLRLVRFGDRSRHLTAADAPPKADRPSVDELTPDRARGGINQISQHPPLYYVVTGTAMRATEGILGDPVGSFDIEVWTYRVMSVLLVAPLPLIVWHTARLLRLPPPVGVAAALVPLAIPQLLHNGSAVNNDSLLLLLFWASTPVVIRLADGQLRPRTAVLAGSLTGLALLTKGFALLMPVWVAAALLLALRRGGRPALRPTVISGAIYGATALALGGWWWVRNVVLYGALSPSRQGLLVRARDGVELDLARFLERWGYSTTRRFWGMFGWYDAGIPGTVVFVATLVVVVALVLAVVRRDRLASTPVGTRLLLLTPVLLLVANQFRAGLKSHLRTGLWGGLQGRYWFGAVAALSVLVALGLAQLLRGRVRWLPLGVLAAGAAMHAVAVSVVLGFYWGEPHSAIGDRVRAVVAWAPLQEEVIAAGAVTGAIVLAATAAQVVALAVRAEVDDHAAPAPGATCPLVVPGRPGLRPSTDDAPARHRA